MIKIKKIISFIIAFIFVSIIVAFVSYKSSLDILKQSEKPVSKFEKEILIDNKPIEQTDNTDFSVLGKYDLANEEGVYNLMHYMINNKVESDAIWGTLDLTKNRVLLLINAANVSNWSDKNNLLEILNRWKNNDFSLAVEDHNYIWNKLGGIDGKATGVKK